MSSVRINHVRLLCPVQSRDETTDVLLQDGRITAIGSVGAADETLDGSGQWLMPGITDLSARLREPGATHKATIASEARAALAAGITRLVMPPDCKPVADSPAVIDRIHAKAVAAAEAKVSVLGALTQGLGGEALGEMAALKAAGVVGVSNGERPLANLLVARRALEYAQGLGLCVHAFALDAALANSGCAHEGATATRLGLAPIPVAAEVAAIRGWISLVEDTGAPVHFGRLSSARAVELIAAAKKRGLPVTCDVAAHQLWLTDAALEGFNAMAHVIPPLRAESDRLALIAGLKDGTIDAICSDHAPHETDAKVNPFPITEAGVSALETLLPLALRLVHEAVLTPLQLLSKLCVAPAALIGKPLGALSTGAAAELVLVDPNQPWTLKRESMLSQGKNSPFLGTVFAGRCVRAFPSR